jgi:hypothetical protein
MTKLVLTNIVSQILITESFGETIAYEDFTEIIPFIHREDDSGDYRKTMKLLNSKTNDTSDTL